MKISAINTKLKIKSKVFAARQTQLNISGEQVNVTDNYMDYTAMEGVTDRELFLHLWQKRNLESEKHDLPQKVDTIRFNLAQLSFLRETYRWVIISYYPN